MTFMIFICRKSSIWPPVRNTFLKCIFCWILQFSPHFSIFFTDLSFFNPSLLFAYLTVTWISLRLWLLYNPLDQPNLQAFGPTHCWFYNNLDLSLQSASKITNHNVHEKCCSKTKNLIYKSSRFCLPATWFSELAGTQIKHQQTNKETNKNKQINKHIK